MQSHAAPASRGSRRKNRYPAAGSLLLACALASAARASDVPRPAPELARPALDGAVHRLGSASADVVLVHFFATWCAPCREEMAALDRLDAEMKGRSFAILAVDVGEPEVRVRRFFQKHPVGFPILLDEDRAALKTWRVEAFPTSLLVTGTGTERTVRLAATAPVDWDHPSARRQIDRLLAGEAPESDAALPLAEQPQESPSGDTQ